MKSIIYQKIMLDYGFLKVVYNEKRNLNLNKKLIESSFFLLL